MSKFGSGSRASFVSPYLRRPLRPLKKVLTEREDGVEDGEQQSSDKTQSETTARWIELHKRAVVSD